MRGISAGYLIISIGIVISLAGLGYDYYFHQKNPNLTLETEGIFAPEHLPIFLGLVIIIIGDILGIRNEKKKNKRKFKI